jgi:hypothetical protein
MARVGAGSTISAPSALMESYCAKKTRNMHSGKRGEVAAKCSCARSSENTAGGAFSLAGRDDLALRNTQLAAPFAWRARTKSRSGWGAGQYLARHKGGPASLSQMHGSDRPGDCFGVLLAISPARIREWMVLARTLTRRPPLGRCENHSIVSRSRISSPKCRPSMLSCMQISSRAPSASPDNIVLWVLVRRMPKS